MTAFLLVMIIVQKLDFSYPPVQEIQIRIFRCHRLSVAGFVPDYARVGFRARTTKSRVTRDRVHHEYNKCCDQLFLVNIGMYLRWWSGTNKAK